MEGRDELTPGMRAILIDWLVEVQENFELYHETLYLAVRIVDLYLQSKVISKQNLQLVGATAMLISAKIEVSVYYIYISQHISVLEKPCLHIILNQCCTVANLVLFNWSYPFCIKQNFVLLFQPE